MKLISKKQRYVELLNVLGGCTLYSLGVNIIIVPLGLYNGGFMGVAQLLRTFVTDFLHVPVPSTLDLAGIIYFAINIPLIYMGYRIMGRQFAVKGLVTLVFLTVVMTLVPIPAKPVIEDYLTACIVGGLVVGTGTGMVLRGRSSAGGQDILGVCFAKRFPNISVGTINIIMNFFVYAVCLFLFDIQIVVYSLIYTTVLAMALDRVHIQNINTSVMIFTKKTGIAEAIMAQTGRGVTDWSGEGAYTKQASYILFVMISKYEMEQIKQIVLEIDPHAFMVFSEGCSVIGNFEKRL